MQTKRSEAQPAEPTRARARAAMRSNLLYNQYIPEAVKQRTYTFARSTFASRF